MRLLFVLCLLGDLLYAQNLVINPGFETYTAKTTCELSQSGATGWSMPSDGTSDLIITDKKTRKEHADGVPDYRHIIPYEGNACAGFFSLPGAHEYVCGSFSAPLKRDSIYTISFAVAAPYNKPYTASRIGIYFTPDQNPYFAEKGMQPLPWKAQVMLDSSNLISEAGYWSVYQISYTASGNERSFIVGDFSNYYDHNVHTDVEATYLFVDDFSITRLTQEQEMEENSEEPVTGTSTDSTTALVIDQPITSDSLIAPGRTLVLENIYFETNKSRILPESYQPLYDIIIEMKLQPDLNVEIVGHTDKHGDVTANQKLSEERARAVADFFISKGIDPSRITTRGYGSSKPVGDDDQKNRRVEFIFTE